MADKLTDEELSKIKPGIAREQAVLMLNLSEVMKEIVLYPETRRGYKHFSCLTADEPAFINNYLFGNEYFAISDLKPFQLAMFTPKLRFYKKYRGTEKLVEIPFDDYLGSGTDDAQQVSLDRYNPGRILEDAAFNGSGVGIQRFEWQLSGDITDTPDKRLQTYAADLTLKVENMADLFAIRHGEDGEEFTIADLFSVELGRPSSANAGDKAHQLFVEVGWHVAEGKIANNEIYDSIGEKALEAIKETATVFKLSLKDHNIDFQQNGAITLTLNYIASLTAESSHPLKSNAIDNIQRSLFEQNVVHEALKKAFSLKDEEVENDDTGVAGIERAEARRWVELREEFQEKVDEFASADRAVGGYHSSNMPGQLQLAKTQKKKQFEEMREIYSKFAKKHYEEIEKRIQEANAIKSCQWIIDRLFEMNRIKVFQVQRENVLLSGKVVKSRKVPISKAQYMDDATSAADYKTEEYVPAGFVAGIDEQMAEANITPLFDNDTNRFMGHILFQETIKAYDELLGETSDILVTVKTVYPTGASTPKARASVVLPDSGLIEEEFDLPNGTEGGNPELWEFLKKSLDGYTTPDANIANNAGSSDGKLRESDVAYQVIKTTVERANRLSEIEGGTREREAIDPFGPSRRASMDANAGAFVRYMRKVISQGRATKNKEGNTYLNIRYVTVGDILDAVLGYFYTVNNEFRDKFILGPVVVNEAEGIVGSPSGLTIRYDEASTESIKLEIVEDPKTKKPVINRKELAKDRVDKIYNLADMPVSLDALLLWVQKNISENANIIYTFDRLLSSILTTVLQDAYAETGEFKDVMPSVDLSSTMDTFVLTQDIIKGYTHDPFGLKNLTFGVESRPPETTSDMNARIKIAKNAHVTLKKFIPKNLAYLTSKAKGGNIVTYHLISTRCKLSDKRAFDYSRDMDDGIPHFFVGKDSGMIKSIEFSQPDVPGLLERNILNAQNSMKDSTGIATAYTRKPHNATVNLVGNTFFSRGQYVFINPTMAGAGSMRDEKSASYRLGLGGYYLITNIANSIDASGRYDTQLECVWQSYGLGDKSATDRNSEPKDQKQAIDFEETGFANLLSDQLLQNREHVAFIPRKNDIRDVGDFRESAIAPVPEEER